MPLFEMPSLLIRRRRRATPDGPRYARYKPVTRWLCDDCVATIHALGVAEAPLPRPVRWRRTQRDHPAMHLCDRHKGAREEKGE